LKSAFRIATGLVKNFVWMFASAVDMDDNDNDGSQVRMRVRNRRNLKNPHVVTTFNVSSTIRTTKEEEEAKVPKNEESSKASHHSG
jgi:hypothetical protein